ncbi:MAG: carbon storage regulator [Pirellulales bacterium]|nr:carbon storage regulator [Pirellulales bacterium]
MLILSRKVGERIMIGDGIEIVVQRISGERVTLGIAAPAEVKILRGELASTGRHVPARDNSQPATPSVPDVPGLPGTMPIQSASLRKKTAALPRSSGLAQPETERGPELVAVMERHRDYHRLAATSTLARRIAARGKAHIA